MRRGVALLQGVAAFTNKRPAEEMVVVRVKSVRSNMLRSAVHRDAQVMTLARLAVAYLGPPPPARESRYKLFIEEK